MPTTKKKKKAKRERDAVPAARRLELAEDFINYDELRRQVEAEILNTASNRKRAFFSQLLALLDLAADAAERVEGFSLTTDADAAVARLASFLR